MAVSCLGAEFKAFMQDASVWSEGYWYDDAYIVVNGNDWESDSIRTIPDAAEVRVEGGEFHVGPDASSAFYSFEQKLSEWLQARTTVTLVIVIDKAKQEAALREISEIDGVISAGVHP